LSLVEHPARVECGTELAATEFAPSYRRATVMQASLSSSGPAVFHCRMACRGEHRLGRGRSAAGLCYPIRAYRNPPTNKQLLNPSLDKHSGQTGQLLARLGCVARGQKRAKRRGSAAIPLSGNFHEIRVIGEVRMVKGMKGPFVAEMGRFPDRVNTWNPVPQSCRTRW